MLRVWCVVCAQCHKGGAPTHFVVPASESEEVPEIRLPYDTIGFHDSARYHPGVISFWRFAVCVHGKVWPKLVEVTKKAFPCYQFKVSRSYHSPYHMPCDGTHDVMHRIMTLVHPCTLAC